MELTWQTILLLVGLLAYFYILRFPMSPLGIWIVIMSLLSSPDKTPLLPSTINHTMGFNFSHYSNCLPSFGHTSPPLKGWPHRVEHDPLCGLASWTITFPVLTLAYGSCITLLTHVKCKAHWNYSLSFLLGLPMMWVIFFPPCTQGLDLGFFLCFKPKYILISFMAYLLDCQDLFVFSVLIKNT